MYMQYSRGDLRRYAGKTGWDRFVGSCPARQEWRKIREHAQSGLGGGSGGFPTRCYIMLQEMKRSSRIIDEVKKGGIT